MIYHIIITAKENEELLTNQDKELLMRWAKMQTVNVPIAPKPEIAVGDKSEAMIPGQKISTGNILVRPGAAINADRPKKMGNFSNEGQISRVQGHSSSVALEGQSQGQSCKNVTQKATFGKTVHKGPAAQQSTLSLLQQHLRSQGQSQGQNEVDRCEGQRNAPAAKDINDHNLTQNYRQNNNAEVVINEVNSKHQLLEGPISSSSGSNFSVDFSTVNLGDLDFLTMISTPKSVTEMNYSMANTACNYTSVTSVDNPHVLPKIEVAVEEQTNTDFPSAGFLQKLCSESMNIPTFPQNPGSQNLSLQSGQQSVSPSHSSPNLSHISPNSQSTAPQFFSNTSPHNLSPGHPENEGNVRAQEIGQHSPEMGRNISPHHISPEISRNVSPHNVQQEIGRNISPNHIYTPEGYLHGVSATLPSFSVNPPFPETLTSASFQSSQFPASSCVNTTNIHPQMSMNSDLNTNNAYQHQRLHQASQMNVDNSIPFGNYVHNGPMKHEPSTSANPLPGLFVNTKQAQMPYRRMFQDQMPGPSGTSNHGGNQLQVGIP